MQFSETIKFTKEIDKKLEPKQIFHLKKQNFNKEIY